MERIALGRGLDLKDIHAIASFYPHFHLQPPARVDVRICDDMSCHLRGALRLQQTLKQKFKSVSNHDLTFRSASCLGRCDHAPAFAINDRYYSGLSESQAVAAVTDDLKGHPSPEPAYSADATPLQSDPYGHGREPYAALKKFVGLRDQDGLLAVLKKSGLQGMGGAGFPTWWKWDTVRKTASEQKYVVCNADESEPGTIKDRYILTRMPHLVIEGMVLAGLCVGATKGYLYIRHEYKDQEDLLRSALRSCLERRLIGEKILGTELLFDLELFVSPGGYICGEESALLEAIEGKRAEPRNKPPFVATVGLWGNPTVVNNVETLAFAAAIADQWLNPSPENPAAPWKWKFVGVTGDVRNPGVFEVPMGIPYSELILGDKYGGGLTDGRQLKAFAPSGPSSGYLPASKVSLPLDWNALKMENSMVGSGAIVVCAEGTCMLDMALNAVRFYRNESCGKCVPCRIGSQKMVEILERWTRGGDLGKEELEAEYELVKKLSFTLAKTSICGLGQIAPKPIQSVLDHFGDEVEEHLVHRRCPAGICFSGARR
jgi:NADH:ubiquinone oxidoreductase subunit F (NADH-binding)